MSDVTLAEVKSVDPDLLQAEINEQIRLLREDPSIREDAEAEGIDLSAFDAIPADTPLFEIEKPANHLGGIAEAILVKIAVNIGAAATMKLAELVWKRVIKPAISKGPRTIEDKV